MESDIARHIAHAAHADQRDGAGRLLLEHVERVAATVPPEARTVAFLHDLLERTATSVAELEASGLTQVELEALWLLTRAPADSFEVHALRIAHAKGPEGRLARMVKLADIEDHLADNGDRTNTRPYGWARRHIATCQERLGEMTPALHSAA
jgi:hypothetical protein